MRAKDLIQIMSNTVPKPSEQSIQIAHLWTLHLETPIKAEDVEICLAYESIVRAQYNNDPVDYHKAMLHLAQACGFATEDWGLDRGE
jgi:hypothetical protein